MSDPFLSVVVPFNDEGENVEPLHAELARALADVAGGIELVYVDDGSRDGTARVLGELAKRDPRVRVLSLAARAGQSAALDAGFRAARGRVIATLDGDGQNDPADLPRLLAALAHADVVNGVRVRREDSFMRRISSRLGNAFRNRVTGERVSDVGCSLRVMHADFLRRVPAWDGMHRFLPTLLRLEGARVLELPVSHRRRRHGRSKYGIGNRVVRGFADVLGVRWLKRRRLRYALRAPENRNSGV